ncbi:MAG: magnesium transporter [Candidatus Palauibacterales bacterium]|nr:magnesium transporter [Candidatus Palauibacterales bacterium]MDP2529503.1 magnesium transporter [Candidatus Palauibacterales bacterium]MDP2585149.1 magnesium transporter [Candidatus Palauibacterales bacterium]
MSERPSAEETRSTVVRMLTSGDDESLRAYAASLHPSDLADVLEHLEESDRVRLLSLLPAGPASDALAEMEDVEQPGALLAQLEPARIAELVSELADDDAADLIGELEPEDQARVLASVHDPVEIEELLHYPPETAGGIMTRELVAVSSELTAGAALASIRRQAAQVDEFFTIFVVDPDGRLRGVASLQGLVLSDPDRPITELVEEPPAVVPVHMDQEEVGRILSRYNLVSIGVLDPLGRLVGRVTFDDVIDVIEAETTEDILRFASVSEEEELRGSTRDAVRSRLPWLLINLLTAVMAAAVVYLFQGTIRQLVLLAVAMPIIAGMGGNAGTQALAVTVRRIALSDETTRELWSVVGKELLVGLINGLVLGLIGALAGVLLAGRPLFGLVVLLAMWGNLVVAGFAGAFIPIFLESVGVDPAVASSIFVTTFTDLCGFFLLLGLATVVLL